MDDEKGGQVTQLPVKAGLSRLFTGQKLSLPREGLTVTQAWQTANEEGVRMVLSGSSTKDANTVTRIDLTFARTPGVAQPLVFHKVEAEDATGAVTTIVFSHVQAGVPLDANMFKFTPRQSTVR